MQMGRLHKAAIYAMIDIRVKKERQASKSRKK